MITPTDLYATIAGSALPDVSVYAMAYGYSEKCGWDCNKIWLALMKSYDGLERYFKNICDYQKSLKFSKKLKKITEMSSLV